MSSSAWGIVCAMVAGGLATFASMVTSGWRAGAVWAIAFGLYLFGYVEGRSKQ